MLYQFSRIWVVWNVVCLMDSMVMGPLYTFFCCKLDFLPWHKEMWDSELVHQTVYALCRQCLLRSADYKGKPMPKICVYSISNET